jgi:hypothetical protein
MFPFSLKDKAKSWLNYLALGSITTWDLLVSKFLAKIIAKTNALRREIYDFFIQNNLRSFMRVGEDLKT